MENTVLELEQSRRVWGAANGLRRDVWGKQVFLRGVIEISSHCRRNCVYCGLRRDNMGIVRYRLSADAVFEQACVIKELGVGTVELASGEDMGFRSSEVAGIIRRIRSRLGLTVALSLGERTEQALRQWRGAGAERYILNLETADPVLYSRLRPGSKLSQRLEMIEVLARLGYEVGSGLLAGLPERGQFGFVRGLELLARLGLDMLSIAPLVPHPATPTADTPVYGAEDMLARMADARVAMPTVHLEVPEALGLHDDGVLLKGLAVGDLLAFSLTPSAQASDYEVYPGKNRAPEGPEERAWRLRRLLLDAGFTLPVGGGGAWGLSQLTPGGGGAS